jgi:DNA helicase-2/ATP-dependent DNA helicase PcrA
MALAVPTGALLLELAARSDVERVRLQLNYRSASRIIRAAEMVLGEARGYRPRDPTREATIAFVERPGGLEDQAKYVFGTLIPAALAEKPGRNIGDIAILYRTAKVGDVIAERAAQEDVSSIRINNAAPYKKTALTSWIEDCAAWCAGGWRQGRPQLGGLIDRWLGFRPGRATDAAPRAAARDLTAFLSAHRTDEGLARPFVEAIRAALVDTMTAAEPSLSDQREQMRRMSEAIAEGGKLPDLDLASLGARDGSPTYLNLLTLHSAKGCEYDFVIMVGMDMGAIAWRNETQDELRESRRLFYVGLTRARDAVHMLYSGWIPGRYGPQRLGRSPFVLELQRRLAAAEGAQR